MLPFPSVYKGWCIHAAVCRECDDILKIPPRDRVDLSVVMSKKGYVRIPIISKMIVPIIREAVAENPGITYQSIREIMKPYAKAFTLIEALTWHITIRPSQTPSDSMHHKRLLIHRAIATLDKRSRANHPVFTPHFSFSFFLYKRKLSSFLQELTTNLWTLGFVSHQCWDYCQYFCRDYYFLESGLLPTIKNSPQAVASMELGNVPFNKTTLVSI